MCIPISGAFNTAAQLYAVKQQSKLAGLQYQNIQEGAAQDYEALNARRKQTFSKAKEQIGERTIQSHRELGNINAILADNGLTGGSADALRREIAMNEGKDVVGIQRNAADASIQTDREIRAVGTRARSAINSVARPSGIDAASSIASGLFAGKGPLVSDLWK